MLLVEDNRIQFLEGALERGNHKSTKTNEAYLAEATSKEMIKDVASYF